MIVQEQRGQRFYRCDEKERQKEKEHSLIHCWNSIDAHIHKNEAHIHFIWLQKRINSPNNVSNLFFCQTFGQPFICATIAVCVIFFRLLVSLSHPSYSSNSIKRLTFTCLPCYFFAWPLFFLFDVSLVLFFGDIHRPLRTFNTYKTIKRSRPCLPGAAQQAIKFSFRKKQVHARARIRSKRKRSWPQWKWWEIKKTYLYARLIMVNISHRLETLNLLRILWFFHPTFGHIPQKKGLRRCVPIGHRWLKSKVREVTLSTCLVA